MRTRIALLPLFLSAAALVGCGTSPPPAAKAPPAAPPPAVAAAPAPAPAADSPEPAVERPKRERPPVDKKKIAQLFQVPEINRTSGPSSAYDVKLPGVSPPAIRFLGFSRIDGELQALIETKGEVLAIEQGDVIDGAEVVAVDDDSISFQFAGQRWSNRLFDKPNEAPVVLAKAGSPTTGHVQPPGAAKEEGPRVSKLPAKVEEGTPSEQGPTSPPGREN